MTFEEAKNERDAQELLVKFWEDKLRAFPRSAIGLVPDSIRLSVEYQCAKVGFDKEFRALQNFNIWFVKAFKSELASERKAITSERMARFNS